MGDKLINTFILLGGIFLVVMIGFFGNYSMTGNTIREGICAEFYVTDISPSSIKVGEEFTVGLLIDNCGSELPSIVRFEMSDPGKYISVKEPLEKDIGQMGYANSQRFLTYHMKVSEDAVPGNYVFNAKLIYGNPGFLFEKEENFSVTIIGDDAKLNIASLRLNPVLPRVGDDAEMTLRIENYGKGSANSVRVYANHSFTGTKESFIGTLDSEEDGPAVFTFVPEKEGEYEIPIIIQYKDDFGDKEISESVRVSILEKKSNFGLILFFILVIGLFSLALYFLFKKNKHKERVIKQMLQNNSVDGARDNVKKTKTKKVSKKK